MLRFVIAITLLAISTAQERPQRSFNQFKYSAASEAQIKNAVENNYDNTGPGAKGPEHAYKTFSVLEDALINYIDDPDTKLPDHERAKAIQRLVDQEKYKDIRYLPKITNEYGKWKPLTQPQPLILNKFSFPNKQTYQNPFLLDFRAVEENNLGQLHNYPLQSYPKQYVDPYKLQTIQAIKSNPINLAHYTRTQDVKNFDEFNPHPQYSFSYGVHDKQTGDSKSAHESRDGGLVRGFYTFMDADGKQRTVHYTADDKLGFRATVQRLHAHPQ